MKIGDYECLFITREGQKKRIQNLFKAIDDGTTDLFWSNRDEWFKMHGIRAYTVPKKIILKASKVSPAEQKNKILKRKCFGKFEQHNFCLNICCLRTECAGV